MTRGPQQGGWSASSSGVSQCLQGDPGGWTCQVEFSHAGRYELAVKAGLVPALPPKPGAK